MTPTAKRVLRRLSTGEAEDVLCEGSRCACGDLFISRRVVDELLRIVALDQAGDERIELYYINETGRALLRRPELETELQAALAARKPFSIISDRITAI